MRTMTQAYVKLANTSFHDENNGENFKTLEDVKNHLDSEIPTYQLFGCKYDSDNEDKGHGNNENGIIRKILVISLNKHKQATTINRNIR